MSLNTFSYLLSDSLKSKAADEIASWNASGKIERIWQKDAAVWSGDDEAKWLGWLGIISDELAATNDYREFYADISTAGFNNIVLMGMGGSSLCPEVLAKTFEKTAFHILDSTDPAQIAALESKLDLTKTLFIVASKSGSTLEPNCFKQYFFSRVTDAAGREKAGRQFVAITDPGSKVEQIAKDDQFRNIFYGDPEIGGRFSALSAFGMTAAASMGLDTEGLLKSAASMADACRETAVESNPGAMLGTILGVSHKLGRDKLTIITSPEIHDLGAWLEQLIAESTGKIGVAIIPVDREPAVPVIEYGEDRVFAILSLGKNNDLDERSHEIAAAGHPVVRIELADKLNIGQEFFRWEFATAVAGSIMGINPFNQPDVESAKIEARKITDEYERTGLLPAETAFVSEEEFSLFADSEYAAKLAGEAADNSIGAILKTHVAQIGNGDYFALLGFIEMNARNEELLQNVRKKVLDRTRSATCLGFGPRFLHSTGQAYKGGANNGVFLQITSDDSADISVPGQKYTFGVVKAAQARGDFQVLLDRGRRALRLHIGKDVAAGLERLFDII